MATFGKIGGGGGGGGLNAASNDAKYAAANVKQNSKSGDADERVLNIDQSAAAAGGDGITPSDELQALVDYYATAGYYTHVLRVRRTNHTHCEHRTGGCVWCWSDTLVYDNDN